MCIGSVSIPFDVLAKHNAQGVGQNGQTFQLQGVGGMPGGQLVLHVQQQSAATGTSQTTTSTRSSSAQGDVAVVQEQQGQKGGFGAALVGSVGTGATVAAAAGGMMKRIPKFWNNE